MRANKWRTFLKRLPQKEEEQQQNVSTVDITITRNWSLPSSVSAAVWHSQHTHSDLHQSLQMTRRTAAMQYHVNLLAIKADKGHHVNLLAIKADKGRYSSSWEPHLRATGHHLPKLPYGITQCYLPPDTSERAPPNPSHAGWYSIYLPRMEGWKAELT